MQHVLKVLCVGVLFLGTFVTTFGQSEPRVYQMVTATVVPGLVAEYQGIIENEVLPIIERNDGELIGSFTNRIGGNSNEVILIIAHRDLANLQEMTSDPALVEIQAGRFASMRVINMRILAPTSFSPLQ